MSWSDNHNFGVWVVRFYGSLYGAGDEADKDHTVIVDITDGEPEEVIKAIREFHDEFAIIKSMKRIKTIQKDHE